MKATELAHAVGAIAAARPEFEPSLATAIKKWLVDSFFKSPDLATLRSAARGDGAKALVAHVRSAAKPDLQEKREAGRGPEARNKSNRNLSR